MKENKFNCIEANYSKRDEEEEIFISVNIFRSFLKWQSDKALQKQCLLECVTCVITLRCVTYVCPRSGILPIYMFALRPTINSYQSTQQQNYLFIIQLSVILSTPFFVSFFLFFWQTFFLFLFFLYNIGCCCCCRCCCCCCCCCSSSSSSSLTKLFIF